MVCDSRGHDRQLIPLHTKSCYSFGFGVTPIEKLVERSAAVGLHSLGLTDVNNLCGQVLFHKFARDRDIHPITGVEINLGKKGKPPSRLVLLARDREGYSNLCEIVTRRQLGQGRRGQDLSAASLTDGINTGLFLMTDSVAVAESLVSTGIDPGSLRLLLVRPCPETAESAVHAASERLSIPELADPDIVFLDPEQYPLHRLSVAISSNTLMSESGGKNSGAALKERYFAGPRRWERLFSDVPEAIEQTVLVAQQCELDLTRNRTIFPGIDLPGSQTASAHLRERCLRGLGKRHGKISPQARSRLDNELGTIRRLGFSDYFIIVADIVGEARRRGISAICRGSGAGSFVAWALEITNVNPLTHGLHFERFLHEGRKGDLPDMDIDLCWIRRDEVIRAVYETYGDDRVAMVSTHNTFQPRSALRETLKSFGLPPTEISRYSNALPSLQGGEKASLGELLRRLPRSQRPPLTGEPFLSAIPLAQQLTDLPRNLSVHCGGIVIADAPIRRYCSLERAAKGVIITQYDKDSVEDAGLVKIDLLGNRCLSEIDETLDWIEKDGGSLKPEEIPDNDKATAELLRTGATIGCFQLESPAMRGLLRKIQPAKARDCMTAIALVRPAAAAGGAKERFIRRQRGEEVISYHHGELRELLEENLGTILYEEDVMRIASTTAGMSLIEGDLLRSSLKKCRNDDDIEDIENHFLSRAVRRGIPPTTARNIWKDLRRFCGYCFSKAHACSYGVLAWRSAWLKANYPVEFSCALLNHHAGMYSKRTIAAEIRRMGVGLLGPCVNRSGRTFSLEPVDNPQRQQVRKIRVSLRQVKGLRESSLAMIFARRPFRNLVDFIRRTTIPRGETESLILAGAFDSLCEGINHPQLLWELASSYSKESGQGDPGLLPATADSIEYPPLADYSPWKKLLQELEYLELNVRRHPAALCREALEEACRSRKENLLHTTAVSRCRVDQGIFVAGLVAATRRIRTSKGEPMLFVTIEDESGVLEGVLFPKACQRLGVNLREPGPYLFGGNVEREHGVTTLSIRSIEPFGELLSAGSGRKQAGSEKLIRGTPDEPPAQPVQENPGPPRS